jgi:hypothetical protein
MTDEDSVQCRQIAVRGLQCDVRGAAVENNKRQLLSVGLYGSFVGLSELQPGAPSLFRFSNWRGGAEL